MTFVNVVVFCWLLGHGDPRYGLVTGEPLENLRGSYGWKVKENATLPVIISGCPNTEVMLECVLLLNELY